MAHNIELVNGKAQMAYAGDVPWHGLGTKVPNDLTPAQMLDAAGLNWTVDKIPAYAKIDGKNVAIGQSALVRSFDNKILDVVSDDWNPVQNEEAFDFFNDFVAAGDMEMHTAGSLQDGKIVWGLAKVKESFELFKGDQIDSYLLFSNFHKYGHSTDVRFTPIRVVCNNTLTLSLNSKVEQMAKICLDVLDKQPGSEYAPGTWWQAFNAVTFVTDHLAGRSADNRLQSAWYGYHKGVKTKALETAVEMAEAA